MNHIGLFIPIIIVISYLIKFFLNLLYFELYYFCFNNKVIYHHYYIIFMAFVYLIFNLLGYILSEKNEIEKIDLPIVIPSIIEFLKRIRILSFILLYFICQIEKLLWEIIFAANSNQYFEDKDDKNYKLSDFVAFIIFFPPILFGFIFDKFEFSGFKWILYTGSIVNVLSCFYCFFLHNKNKSIIDDNFCYALSIINEIFRAGNYAIFLPEIIKKFEIKNLLILSGLVSASNFFVQPLEVMLTNIFKDNKNNGDNLKLIILLVIQVCCSIVIFGLLFFKVVNENLGMSKLSEVTDVKGRDLLLQFNEEEESDLISLESIKSISKSETNETDKKNDNSYNLIEG